MLIRPIAFYLPQFHPIPENDEWWGCGFTEWHNAARARPLLAEHYQPHLPADLGFYDLRLPEARAAQADLARQYGVGGFCYYHYWFKGRRLLERPFDEVLASGQPDFPFCLCWANENWTRNWDGLQRHILVEQRYSPEDDRRHIQWLLRAFADPRYLRVEGKAVFLVYRAACLPEPRRTTDLWREAAQRAGVGELLLCRVQGFGDEMGDPREIGFDAGVEFTPNCRPVRPERSSLMWRVSRRLRLSSRVYGEHTFCDYRKLAQAMLHKPAPPFRHFRCVTPSWDNSPRRRKGATVFLYSSPEAYEQWLEATARQVAASGEELLFLNAWNEWGEGNHLEPCQKWGHAYLEATQRALKAAA